MAIKIEQPKCNKCQRVIDILKKYEQSWSSDKMMVELRVLFQDDLKKRD